MAKWDLVVRGGRVIDPESGFDAVADVAIVHRELARERMIHRARHGVASLRAIQGKRKHALIERGEEIRCTSVQGGDRHQCFPIHVAQTKIIQFAIFHTSRSTRALAELAMTQRIPFLGRRRRSLSRPRRSV